MRDLSTVLSRLGATPDRREVSIAPLAGGLEAAEVARIAVRWRERGGRARSLRLVRKVCRGPAVREAEVYERLVARYAPTLAPALVSAHRLDDDVALYLEHVEPVRPWPWNDRAAAGAVLARLAELHTGVPDPAAAVPAWDYEAELAASGAATLAHLEGLRANRDTSALVRGAVPAVARLVEAMPRLRRELEAELGVAALHGDVHPGNVLLRATDDGEAPVLVDWARARVGSPLEDVASWLQSLGLWEPEARRRHDSLLTGYLGARGEPAILTPPLRDAVAIAGARNVLAGALRYHLHVAATCGDPTAARCARDWIRVVRRAAAAVG